MTAKRPAAFASKLHVSGNGQPAPNELAAVLHLPASVPLEQVGAQKFKLKEAATPEGLGVWAMWLLDVNEALLKDVETVLHAAWSTAEASKHCISKILGLKDK